MSRVWFTADTHFGHKGALKFRPNRFASVEAMDTEIIDNWNSVVAKGDRVYHLGDFSLAKPDRTLEILNSLNGQIYLVRGNHDSVAVHSKVKEKFIWIRDYEFLKVGNVEIALSHYPFLTWRNSHWGSWHLHGHCHGGLGTRFNGRRHDVGVDTNEFRPYNFEELVPIIEAKVFEAVDHHTEKEPS